MPTIEEITKKYSDPNYRKQKQQEIVETPIVEKPSVESITNKYSNSNLYKNYIKPETNAIQENWQAQQDIYNALPSNPDFAIRSQPVQDVTNDRYTLINGGVVYGEPISEFDNAPSETRFADVQEINQMNDGEKATYNYIFNTQGQLKADEYIRQLQPILNQRRQNKFYNAETREGKVADMSNGQLVGANIASVGALPMSAVSSVDIAGQKGRQIFDKWSGRTQVPLDFNTPAQAGTNYRDAIRQETSNRIENPIANFIYQTGMSIADTTVSIALASAGIPNPGRLLGLDAGIQTAKEAKARGLSDNYALLTGVFASIAEEFFEEYSIDKLLTNGLPKDFKSKLFNVLKQMGTEGSEEVFTSIANRISDGLINADRSQIQMDIQDLVAKGYSLEEATKIVEINFAKQLALDFAGGAVSGGVFGAGANIRSDINATRIGSQYIENDAKRQGLKTEAKNLGGEAKEYASKISDDTTRKTQRQLGYQDILNKYETINKAVEKAQNDYGMNADAMTLRSLQKQASGDNLTAFDEARIRKYNEQYQKQTAKINKTEAKTFKEELKNTDFKSKEKKEIYNQVKENLNTRKASDIISYKAGENALEMKQSAEKLNTAIRNSKLVNELNARGTNLLVDVDQFKDNTRLIGKYDPSTKTLILNPLASTSEQMAYVMAHEIIHDAKAKGKESFNDVASLYLGDVGYKGMPTFKDGKLVKTETEGYDALRKELDNLKAEKLYKKFNDETLFEEVVAHYVERQARKSDNVELIFKDKTKAKSFLERVNETINKLAGTSSGIDQQWKKLADSIRSGLETKTEESTRFQVEGNRIVDTQSGKVVDEDVNNEAIRNSLTSMDFDLKNSTMIQDLVDAKIFSEDEANSFVKSINHLMNVIDVQNDAYRRQGIASYLDMNEKRGKHYIDGELVDTRLYKTVKPNSDDLYKISLDYSTLCKKRILTQAIIERLNSKLADKEGKVLTGKEQFAITEMIRNMQDQYKKIQVACALCYVESARIKSPKHINIFLQEKENVLKNYYALKNKDFQYELDKALEKYGKDKLGDWYSIQYSKEELKKIVEKNGLKWTNVSKDIENFKKDFRQGYSLSDTEQEVVNSLQDIPNSKYVTSEGLDWLNENHHDVWDAFTSYIRKATHSKAIESDEAYYYGDLAQALKEANTSDLIGKMNAENGSRYQSWSDFQLIHLLDNITAIAEYSVNKAKMQSYTKVPEFVYVNGLTNLMINVSLIAKGKTGLDSNGNLDFSSTEGMPLGNEYERDTALYLRRLYPQTCGTILVGVGHDNIVKALASDYIDYVIPYHTSSLSNELRKMAKINNWFDFQPFQNETIIKGLERTTQPKETWHKKLNFSDWFTPTTEEKANMDGKELMKKYANKYLKMCKERGLHPKFSGYATKRNYTREADFTDQENYWKVLIDRKMVNQLTNKYIEQLPVKPNFDWKLIEDIVSKAEDPQIQENAKAISDELLKKIQNGELNELVGSNSFNKKYQNLISSILGEDKYKEPINEKFYKDFIRNSDTEIPIYQRISSADTSLAQIPALFKDKNAKFGKTNIDIGGGKYDLATDYLKSIGTRNYVFDPYNRDEQTNSATLKFLQDGNKADTSTCANVLNVIQEPSARENVILEVAKSIKQEGKAYFTVYEGDGSGIGRETNKGWQNNKKTSEYVNEISKYFEDVEKHGKLIVASNPINNLPQASWETTLGKAIRYSDTEIATSPLASNERALKILKMLDKTFGESGNVLSPRHIRNLFNEDESYDYIDRILYKEDTSVEEELKNIVTHIGDAKTMNRFEDFYIDYARYKYRNTIEYGLLSQKRLDQAISKFKKYIKNARELAGSGTNLQLKKGKYSLETTRKLFDQLNTSNEMKSLADKVFDVAGQLGANIYFVNKSDMLSRKGMGEVFGEAWVDIVHYNLSHFNSKIYTDEQKAKTILHELIHTCTALAIDVYNQPSIDIMLTPKQTKAVEVIKEVYNVIKNSSDFVGEYGIKNEKEMLAELSNAKFAEKLKKKNLWDRLIEAIKNFFGIETKTAHDALYVSLEQLLQSASRQQMEEYSRYASRTKTDEDLKYGGIRYSDAQIDAEYMDAVNKGDTETAQKLVDRVAKENGYTIKAYHGTRNNFTIFDSSIPKNGRWLGKGIYFTDQKPVANFFGGGGLHYEYGKIVERSPNIITAYLKIQNPFVIDGDNYQKASEGEYYVDTVNEIIEKYGEEFADNYLDSLYSFDFDDIKEDAEDYYNGNIRRAIKGYFDYCKEEFVSSDNEQFEKFYKEISSAINKKEEIVFRANEKQIGEIVREQMETGKYDGAIVKNVSDGVGYRQTVYFVFNPNQIKSADTITYDDNGNVIPLSERFNDSNNDIRWSDTELDANDPIYQELLKVYGIMDKGANRSNTVDVPKATHSGNVRRFAQSQMESQFADEKYNAKMRKAIANELMSYPVEGDAKAIEYANNTLNTVGFKNALKLFNDAIATDNVDKKMMVLGQRLWIESAQKKDYDTMMDIGSSLAVQGTRSGQIIQSLSLIKKFSPQGQLMTLEKYVDQLNKDRMNDPKVSEEVKQATEQKQVVQKDIDKLQKKIDDKTKKNQLKEEQINELNEQIAKLKEEYDKLKKQTYSDTAKIVRRNQKLQELDGKIKQLAKNLKVVESHLENLDNEVKEIDAKKKQIAELDKTINKYKVKLSNESINAILETQTRGELDRAVENAYIEIATQVPSTWLDKWNAWRYMAMLTNPTTHIRNLVGNLAFIPAMELKNLITYGLQNSSLGNKIGLDEKTTFNVDQKYKDEAKKVYEENTKFLMSSGKYNKNDIITENRRIFNTQVLEYIRKLNGNLLEAEDAIFLKRAFVEAYSRYLQANPNADKQKAFDYAKNESWKATYRDASLLADKINNFAKTNAGTELLVGAIIPFKKTPINILKRGIEYSPIGVFKSIYDMTYALKHPNKYPDLTPSKALDELASGLSGTIILLIGMLLARWGFLNGKGDPESTSYEKQVMGFQPFSMNIGDNTYTLDWMSPSAMPLFTGVEIYNALQGDFEFKGIMEALYNIPAPLFEMSLLSGMAQVIDQAKYADSTSEKAMLMASTAVTSYLGQAFPTLGRRIASILDANTRNVYYNDKTTNIPKGMQTFGRQVANKIPFASKSLEPKIDVWGRDITTGFGERTFEALVSPGYIGRNQATKVDNEIIRVYQATANASVIPSTSRTNYYKANEYDDNGKLISSETKYMDINAYTSYSILDGRTQYENINKLISTSFYKSLSDEEKAKAISEMYSYAKWFALRKTFSDYKSDTYDKTQELLNKTGMTYAQYYSYYKKYQQLLDEREYKLDKEGNKEYKKSASEVLKKYLMSTDLNTYQCREFYKKIFPTIKTIPAFIK